MLLGAPAAGAPPMGTDGRVIVDGKFFAVDGRRFPVRGVTYGTFAPRPGDAARFPELDRMKRDLIDMRDTGFTVVRTYTEPPPDLLSVAADCDLRVMAGVFWPDWRYLVGSSRREAARIEREARHTVEDAARRLADDPRVFALCLGNEIPADVIRWFGTERIASVVSGLADAVRAVDPRMLVTYGNYPTAEYLPLESLDFLTFNIFLERRGELASYLTRLHHQAGDRPLVLGELGLHAGDDAAGEERQAEHLEWQLETALERGVAGTFCFSWTDEWHVGDEPVEGWRFGLTREDRSPRPALEVAERWNAMTVAELDDEWPTISIVICAYNAAATLDECLEHTCALAYPGLEIIVVDDGSTDDTAAIARRHPRARLLTIDHAGLSVARNEGFRLATGDVVAYLDSDAYPTPEWPFYLALGFDGRDVAGVGGPNVPPPDDPHGAQVVARAPGGPVHVLTADNRAEHVPGCNMAFWRYVLEEIGGFDPVYEAAGDDVDFCWKVLDRQWDIGFHPAALVWHHRRPGLRPYLRQQRGYGRAEALVEARHPDRFSPLGTARWRGRIYNPLEGMAGRSRIYRGIYGAAAYQSVYHAGGHALDVAHQAGIPISAGALATAPLALLEPALGAPAVLAVLFVLALAVLDFRRADPPRDARGRAVRFRLAVVAHHLLQPVVRAWGRLHAGRLARRELPDSTCLPGPATSRGGVVVLPACEERVELSAGIVEVVRRSGIRAAAPSGWEDHDARLSLSVLTVGDVVSSGHPVGWLQVKVRPGFRNGRVAASLAAAALFALTVPVGAVAVLGLAAVDAGAGLWRARIGVPRIIRDAAT